MFARMLFLLMWALMVLTAFLPQSRSVSGS